MFANLSVGTRCETAPPGFESALCCGLKGVLFACGGLAVSGFPVTWFSSSFGSARLDAAWPRAAVSQCGLWRQRLKISQRPNRCNCRLNTGRTTTSVVWWIVCSLFVCLGCEVRRVASGLPGLVVGRLGFPRWLFIRSGCAVPTPAKRMLIS